MPRSRLAYPLDFRQGPVELIHAGRNLGELAKELEPTAQTIRNCLAATPLHKTSPSQLSAREQS